jgi:hypothetical protein
MRTAIRILAIAAAVSWPHCSRAAVYVLKSGGQIEGDVVAGPDGGPKETTHIRTPSGGELMLDNSQIERVIPQSDADKEYEKLRPTVPDTVDGQWKMAEWCREHRLDKQREVHLERVIALDPDHKQARAALGYMRVDGRWLRADDAMRSKGYVRYKGDWVLPQTVELLEQRRKDELAATQWFGKLKLIRNKWDANPEQAAEKLRAIQDPAAVRALDAMIASERQQNIKLILLQTLVQIGSGDALKTVVATTLDDPEEEVRWSALDMLVAAKHPEVSTVYIQALKSKDNVRINRAAFCLGKLKDKSAISPLIDALQTPHKFVESSGGNPGQMSTTFGNGPGLGGGGLSIGGKPKVYKVMLENQEVLAALMILTDNTVHFGFEQKQWKTWYASQRKPVTIDARRDGS